MSNKQKLFGEWESDPTDREGLAAMGQVSISFTADDRLIYTIHEEARDQIIVLNYRVQDDRIYTNQPTHPREEVSGFAFSEDGKLILTYEGAVTRYVRKLASKIPA